MQLRVFTVVSAIAIAFAGCAASSPREFGKGDVDSITKLIQDLTAAYNAKDPAKIATLFAATAVVMPPNAPMLRGTESIQFYFEKRFAQGATDAVITPKDVSGVGPLAYASGEYDLRLAPSGGPERPDRGKFLWVLRNFNGKWLLVYLIFSSDFAPSPQ